MNVFQYSVLKLISITFLIAIGISLLGFKNSIQNLILDSWNQVINISTNADILIGEEKEGGFENFLIEEEVSCEPSAIFRLDEGNGNSVIDSEGNIPPSIVNGATWTNGISNSGLYFDGSNDYVESPIDADFSGATFSISTWVYLTSPFQSGYQVVLEYDRYGDNWFGFFKVPYADKFQFRWSNNNPSSADFQSLIEPDKWYHLVGTFDSATGEANLYFNGNLDRTVTNAGVPAANTSKLRIGASHNNNEYIKGIIDEVQVYPCVLSSTDVLTLYKEGSNTICNELINPNFENGTTNWNTNVNTGYSATFSTENTAGMIGSAFRASIASQSGSSSGIQLLQNVSLNDNTNYNISFKAKAQSNRTIKVVVQKATSPNTIYYISPSINITSTTQDLSFDFSSSITDPNAVIKFELGTSSSDVWLDDIVFKNNACPTLNGQVSDCTQGNDIDLVWNGLQNEIPITLAIPNPSNVYQIIVEVVYKGSHPASTWVTDASGTVHTMPEYPLTGGSPDVHLFRTTIDGSTSSLTYNNTTHQDDAQSIIAFVYRENVPGKFVIERLTNISGYHSTVSWSFNIYPGAAPRDLHISLPMSEITLDNRILNFTATAGPVTHSFTQGWGSNWPAIPGCCVDIIEFDLLNVPANVTTVTIGLESPSGTPNGQSYVVSGLIALEQECSCPPISIIKSASNACLNDPIVFSSPDAGLVNPNYEWDFGVGATPATAFGSGPHSVSYATAGTKAVTLHVNNLVCDETITTSVDIGQDVYNLEISSITSDYCIDNGTANWDVLVEWSSVPLGENLIIILNGNLIYDIVPIGNSFSFTVDDVNTGDGGTDNFEVYFSNHEGCGSITSVPHPDACSIDIEIGKVFYENNNTPDDHSDDTISFEALIIGNGSGGWIGGGQSGSYGQMVVYGPYPLSPETISFYITDVDLGCEKELTIDISNNLTPGSCTCSVCSMAE